MADKTSISADSTSETSCAKQWDTIIIFQHIAKTGGSSIGEALSTFFPIEQQLSVSPGPHVTMLGTWSMEYPMKAWENLLPQQRDAIRLVGGHLPFGVHRIFSKPATYVTLLRDPVERVLSGFYYSIERHFAATGERVTLEEYVFRKRHYDLGLNNHQTRVLSGIEYLDPFGDFTTENARPITRDALGVAIKNLRDHYLLIGVTEEAEQFLARFAGLMGWPRNLIPSLPLRNVTENRPIAKDIEPRIIEEIRRHNQFDLELHEYTKKTFDTLREI
jgi:hypothetical protein